MNESLTSLSCDEFCALLASDAPAPGGGAAAALAGALGVSLCSMTAHFSAKSPRFAEQRAQIDELIAEAQAIRGRLLELVDEDARGFEPLAAAYALPKDDPARPEAIEEGKEKACMAPLAIMGECARAQLLLERIGDMCSKAISSDVASGAVLVRAAVEVASINVCANTATLKDRSKADAIDSAASDVLNEFVPRADALASKMCDRFSAKAAS